MTRVAWMLVLGYFLLVLAAINLLLPIPDINDFNGLGLFCLLMERRGILNCVNFNWGFANPLANHLLTVVTNNLLFSQRILSAVGSVGVVIFAERMMVLLFRVNGRRTRMLFLLALISSPWMLEAMVSVHLDVIPIALTMAALSLLPAARPSRYLLAGFVITMGYWFRFHFLLYALLYIFIVYLYRRKEKGFSSAFWTAVGFLLSFSVSAVLSYLATGKIMSPNSSLQFSLNLPDFNWSMDYMLALENKGVTDIFTGVNLLLIFVRAVARILASAPLSVLLFLFSLLFVSGFRKAWASSPSSVLIKTAKSMLITLQDPHLLVMCFVVFPFIFLVIVRGITVRLEACLFFILFPVLASLFRHRSPQVISGLVAAIVVLSLAQIPGSLQHYQRETRGWNKIDREIGSVIPQDIRKNSPELILNTIFDYQNKYNRYWGFNPVLIGGWPVLSRPLRDEFGILDIARLHLDNSYKEFLYIILAKEPKYSLPQPNKELLNLVKKVHHFDEITVLEVGSPSSK